jgi:hypothetical protein
MKTKNNVQKTILRSVAVVVSFVLISFTVSAQDFWKKLLENSSFNEIAMAMVETSGDNTDSESTNSTFNYALLEIESEPTLELEDWMNDESFFSSTTFSFVEESDVELELEDWMIDESVFSVEQNQELPLELEAWMTSEEVWKI